MIIVGRMLFLSYLLIVIFEYSINVNGIRIGKMINVSLNVPFWSIRLINAPIINGTCEECLCSIIKNSLEIGSFNCFINNNTCQLFSKANFYEYWFNNDTEAIFYFLQEPTSINNI